ncbi:ferredoxin [Nocardioides humi]|uniref:Ferredoxin n=1 Tax=Nocardioides humi TaxID=449461 RepID=A0ABN2AB40_9ACTN|nr:ferredoxin [Nocardioides humi]
MRITADSERCIGAGQCVLVAPEVFDQDDDGTVVMLAETVGAEGEAAVREAIDICPARAIFLVDA